MSSATSPIFSFLSQYREEQALPSSASMTPEEYHAFLPLTPRKYEYHEGKAVLMAGASPEPNLIAKNLLVALDVALESLGSDCDVFGSDQKVYVSRRKILLPDVIVACEPLQVDENDCLRNPVLIAEVLSPSTASYDENDKFRDYRAADTMSPSGRTAPPSSTMPERKEGCGPSSVTTPRLMPPLPLT